ncbi:MAG: hypothetical protein FRX48_07235 [Lasallia pustulata]|uniref:ubiquitinyl hydrolase 1 n=1 Tax=Lasallia pustulata TaxID=136370 RepID=A0A5M8PHM7_9LECA|nr:MAG: hypothetical protein FRX48_07235 [Lasallia pustulata]
MPLQGGKTAPRLLQDLLLYDPCHPPSSGYNLLAELPVPFENARQLPGIRRKGSCEHRLVLKPNQCLLPELDTRPEPSTVYQLAAHCLECRCHVKVVVDYRGEGAGLMPCPTEDVPLHHFLLTTQSNGRLEDATGPRENSWVQTQQFQCSSMTCRAAVTIQVRPPRLTTEWVTLLSDKDAIKERAEKAMAEDPVRFEGHAPPSPVQVLINLRLYIANAMKDPDGRRILGNNKKWMLCLGDACADLLDPDWWPPRPNTTAILPYDEPLNLLLDDVESELLTLATQRPVEERRTVSAMYAPIPAMQDLQRVLGSLGYKKTPASRTVDLTQEEHPFYAGLGATGDFDDELIVFAYGRQILCDPGNTPYYLECLQGIGEGRKSEELQYRAVLEESEGKISLKDVRNSYSELGLTPKLDDDTIIGAFNARLSDSPKQEAQLRRALKIIGQSRNSDKIQVIASNTVTTYEQALSWLGATAAMDDAFLTSMYSVKVSETKDDEPVARHAIALIAEARKSGALKSWLDTGVLGEVEMDVGQAYTRLGIDDRTVDDDTILATYNILAGDTPSQLDDLRRALTAIADSKDSYLIKSFLNTGMVSSENAASEWPVGLENIGNTCYLNSLLQFYFTVKPLRELVLEFDKYKMEIEEDGLRKKQVGSRRVSRKEVERAQRFVYELQKLFRSMISAPTAQVTPEQELARLTLISSTTEEQIRRQSMLSAHRPSLGEIDGRPILGPQPPPAAQPADVDSEMSENTTSTRAADARGVGATTDDDASSEATLVEKPLSDNDDVMVLDTKEHEQQQGLFEDKENLPPSKADLVRPSTPDNRLAPLAESSPSRANEQQRQLSPAKEPGKDREDTVMANDALPTPPPEVCPTRTPPPVPPRPIADDQKKTIQEEVEIGAQQDVTEVIANVLFQLQCAMKAQSVDESGEQIDLVKELFFGKQKSYITNKQGMIRSKEEFISDIKIDVASGPRDIYAAFDGAYDEQEVEIGGALEPQYTTISQLPPVLQVLVQRVQFDAEKKTTFKSNHHLELKETIYLDRYMDSGNEELLARRRECWRWKKDLAELEKRKAYLTTTEVDLDMPEALTSAAGYLRQLSELEDDDPIEIKPVLLQYLESAAQGAKKEMLDIDERIKTLNTSINSQFTDLRNLPYRLHSVFIHRGYVSSGHYWIYIYDFAKEIWRKYNDGYVTEVKDTREIFDRDPADRPATPYFLVYVRDDLKHMLVDSVCRDIVETPQQQQHQQSETTQGAIVDVDMADRPAREMLDWLQPNHSMEDAQEGASDSVTGWSSEALHPVYGPNPW